MRLLCIHADIALTAGGLSDVYRIPRCVPPCALRSLTAVHSTLDASVHYVLIHSEENDGLPVIPSVIYACIKYFSVMLIQLNFQ